MIISFIYGFQIDEIRKCKASLELQVFFIGVIVLTSLIIVNEMAILYVSVQGTLTNASPRQHMPKLLYFQLTLYFPELIWTILGTYWTVKHFSYSCQLGLVVAVCVSVALEWAILLTVLIGALVLFDPLGKVHSDPFEQEFSSTMQESAKKVWISSEL